MIEQHEINDINQYLSPTTMTTSNRHCRKVVVYVSFGVILVLIVFIISFHHDSEIGSTGLLHQPITYHAIVLGNNQHKTMIKKGTNQNSPTINVNVNVNENVNTYESKINGETKTTSHVGNNNSNNNKQTKGKQHTDTSSSTTTRNSSPFLPWNITRNVILGVDDDDNSTSSTSNSLPNIQSIRMIYQYYNMHSVDALLQDKENIDSLNNRTYAIGFLPCIPSYFKTIEGYDTYNNLYYTSEIIHNFLNTLTWSMITNRTIIVQWYNPLETTTAAMEDESIISIDFRNTSSILLDATCSITTTVSTDTNNNNKQSSLQQLLSLTSWMVQWKDIYSSSIINMDDLNIIPIPIDTYRQNYDTFHPMIIFPQINTIHIPLKNYKKAMNKIVSDTIFHNAWMDHPLGYVNGIKYIQSTHEYNRHIAVQLYYENSDFLYGVLFHICFPYFTTLLYNNNNQNDDKSTTIVSSNNQQQQTTNSFALLSIPTIHNDDDDETNDNNILIDTEIKCLRKLLPMNHDPKHCQIVLLSTNPMIVDRITEWIISSKRQCTVVHTSSSTTQESQQHSSRKHHNKNSISNNINNHNNNDDGNDNDDDATEVRDTSLSSTRKRNSKPKNDNNNHHRQLEIHNTRISIRDIYLASNIARTGVIGPVEHPDFKLMVEWIAYHRQMEYITGISHNHRDRTMKSITTASSSTSGTALEPLLWCEL
jgi:hypothetical protein